MKLKIATKLVGGYLLLTVFVIIAGGAGVYSVNRLADTLKFVTTDAWNAADGAMEQSIAVREQMLAVQDIVRWTQSGDRLGGQQYGEKSNAEYLLEARARLQTAVSLGSAAGDSMLKSTLIDEQVAGSLAGAVSQYQETRDLMLDAHARFVKFDTDLQAGISSFGDMLGNLKSVAEQAAGEFVKNANRQFSWNSGLREKWQAAQGVAGIESAFLQRIDAYKIFVTGGSSKTRADEALASNLTKMRDHISTIGNMALFRDFRSDKEGASINPQLMEQLGVTLQEASVSEMLTDEMDIHEMEFKTAVEAYNAYRITLQDYERVAAELMTLLDEVERIGDAAVEQQAGPIQATITSAYGVIAVVVLLAVSFALAVAVVTTRIMQATFQRFIGVAEGVAKGDLETVEIADAELGDEIGDTLVAVKAMVEKLSDENRQLNDSVIDLLEATAQLSERDLTVQVPVANDITGPVSDAVKVLVYETAKVLKEIRDVAELVEGASNTVRDQGVKVSEASAVDREMTFGAISVLTGLAEGVGKLADLAETCDEMARRTTSSISDAMQEVLNTGRGMNDLRETISETEKRIKRLGERSQEISSVVEIINNVAERTHILALNASMQAAAAGDAGRGFAVVADEVQRLAESSRQSTSEIAALVSNIQSETSETMAAMNKAISQVVDGTAMAKKSGEQMESTVKTTEDLSGMIGEIAQSARTQSDTLEVVAGQAQQVTETLTKTGHEMEEQASVIEKLLAFARQLTESVRQFKLPG